jgi:hypothetical protein
MKKSIRIGQVSLEMSLSLYVKSCSRVDFPLFIRFSMKTQSSFTFSHSAHRFHMTIDEMKLIRAERHDILSLFLVIYQITTR